jgi:transcriptional regulator with XRE-family HTH domain
MAESTDHFDFDFSGFAKRLREAIFPERMTAFAERVGVPHPTVSKYLRAEGISPRLDIAAVLARGAGVTLEWLVWGVGDGPDESAGFVKVPRYDATLAAGAGSWNEGRRRLDDIPFTAAFLRKRLNRTSTKGLTVLEARGDSMEKTISDGALMLIDEDQKRITDGIFAFVLDGDARVKRFRKLIDGIMLVSDNAAYAPETVSGNDQAMLQIIGPVLWVGQLV